MIKIFQVLTAIFLTLLPTGALTDENEISTFDLIMLSEQWIVSEVKAAEWKGPELITSCSKWAKTDGAKICVGHKSVCVDKLKYTGGWTCKGWATRCVKWAKSDPIKTCIGHKTIFKNHRRYVLALADSSIRNLEDQLEDIVDACLTAAVSSLAVGGVSIDLLASVFTEKLPVAEETFKTCLRVQQSLSELIVEKFELKYRSEDGF